MGDCEWGVVDLTTGLTASAKHPARFGALLACRAALDDDGAPHVPLPDGRTVRAGEPTTGTLGAAAPGGERLVDHAPGRGRWRSSSRPRAAPSRRWRSRVSRAPR